MDSAVRICTCATLVLLAAPWLLHAAQPAVRTWTDDSGTYKVRAEFAGRADGAVRLKKTDGQIVSVPLARLSAADRRFVEQLSAARRDVIEFLSGARVEGKITARDDEYIAVRVTIGGRDMVRKYLLQRVGAITVGGRREVLRETAAGGSTTRAGAAQPPSADARRTPGQVDALIERIGRQPPDWWDSVPLEYPKTLDLSWPMPAPQPWNAQKNMGQYVWDVINPNPGKWRSGVRLMHHLLSMHAADPTKRVRVMNSLARMYQLLLEDYARAAFWWRKAGADRDNSSPRGINLATCYWKLGSKQMAVDLLKRLPNYYPSIKLWADMGQTDWALRLAEAGARGNFPDLAYLYAADACRVAGRHAEALGYYQKVLDVPAKGQAEKRIQRNHQRAAANMEAIRLFEMLDLSRVADGSYRASAPAYAGMLHVEVAVAAGRIQSVKVTDHKEKQFYSALSDTPRKILQMQGVKGVDAITGATMTSEAIINATAKALSGGMK